MRRRSRRTSRGSGRARVRPAEPALSRRARARVHARLPHNRRDERSAPSRRHDDVLEPDRRRRAPLSPDQARVACRAAALAPHDRRAAQGRRRRGAPALDAAVAAAARQRRLPAALAARRDRARARRPRARPDRSRRPVPRRLGRARCRAGARHSRRSRTAIRTSQRWRAWPPARGSAPRPRAPPSATRAMCTAASTSCSRRASAWRAICATGASSGSPASRSASTPPCSAPKRWPALARSGTASRPTRALLVYAGRFAPEKHLDLLADAVRRLGAPYVLARRRRRAGAAAGGRSRRGAARSWPRRRARDRARQRRCVRARRRPGNLRPLGARGDGVRHAGRGARRRRPGRAGRGRRRDRRRRRQRRAPSPRPSLRCSKPMLGALARAARRRAEASDWQRVLPGLIEHYLRLIGRAGVARRRSAERRPMPAAAMHRSKPSRRAHRLHRPARRRAVDARGLRTRSRGRAGGRGRRAGDDPRRAALSRRIAEPRVRGLARRARAPRRRAGTARLHPSRRRHARRLARQRCAAAPTRAAKASSGRSRAARRSSRIDVGIAWFERNGWPLSGFVAPAWLLGPGAREALVERPFEYTATLRQLVHLPAQVRGDEPERRLQHLERLASPDARWRWNAVVGAHRARNPLLRIELHPRDADFAGVQRSWQTILRARPARPQARHRRRVHARGEGAVEAGTVWIDDD